MPLWQRWPAAVRGPPARRLRLLPSGIPGRRRLFCARAIRWRITPALPATTRRASGSCSPPARMRCFRRIWASTAQPRRVAASPTRLSARPRASMRPPFWAECAAVAAGARTPPPVADAIGRRQFLVAMLASASRTAPQRAFPSQRRRTDREAQREQSAGIRPCACACAATARRFRMLSAYGLHPHLAVRPARRAFRTSQGAPPFPAVFFGNPCTGSGMQVGAAAIRAACWAPPAKREGIPVRPRRHGHLRPRKLRWTGGSELLANPSTAPCRSAASVFHAASRQGARSRDGRRARSRTISAPSPAMTMPCVRARTPARRVAGQRDYAQSFHAPRHAGLRALLLPSCPAVCSRKPCWHLACTPTPPTT